MLLKLPQGYWATLTAVLVVQTSVGGALAVSRDRLIGTVAGAVVGAAAVYAFPKTILGDATALTLAVAVLAFGAAKAPSLKIGPITAIIGILAGGSRDTPVYAAERVGEIMLGSLVGVAATLLIFPARARAAAIRQAGVLLAQLDEVFGLFAGALARNAPSADTVDLNARIRTSLAALETHFSEAMREERAHLGSANLPEGLPRTLWRVRGDSVVIGRTLSRSFAPIIADRLLEPAHDLMRAARDQLGACAAALAAGAPLGASPVPAAATTFRAAFRRLREEGVMRGLEFEEIGHVFGLAWAFDGMERNLADLADRIDETVSRNRTAKPTAASAD